MLITDQIRSWEDIKGGAASIRMVVFGLRNGLRIPDRETYLDEAINICQLVSQGFEHEVPSSLDRAEDLLCASAFIALAPRTEHGLRLLPEIREKAAPTKRILEKLKISTTPSPQDLDSVASFFDSVYKAM